MTEINRAEIVPDEALEIELNARSGSWVNYWTRRRMFRKTVQLVWPEGPQVRPRPYLGSVPIGRGTDRRPCRDQMPYFVAGAMNVVTIESVNSPSPMSILLIRYSALPCWSMMTATIQERQPPQKEGVQ